MNSIGILDSHVDFGNVDKKKLEKVEKRVLFTLHVVETKFNISEMSTQQIYHILNDKFRIKTSMQAINMAISRAGNKISSIKKEGIVCHKIMSKGVDELKDVVDIKQPKEVIDLIISNEIIEKEKDYFKKVIRQINGCYQDGYYDACFVMIRRSIETLIVDVYEHFGKESEIKDLEGDYLNFSKLVDKVLENNVIKLSKIAKRDIKIIKKFGDTAAHNRKVK